MNNTVTRSNCSTSKQNDLTKCGQRQPSRMQMQRTCDLSFSNHISALFSRHLQATWTNIDRSYGLSYLSTSDSLFRVYHGSASIHSDRRAGKFQNSCQPLGFANIRNEIFRIFDSENQKQIKFKSSFTCLKSQLCALAEVPHGRNVARDNRIVVRNFSSGPGGFAEVCKDGRCVAKRARISPSSFNLFDSDQN